ncbi:MAG: homocysteine S-methyltransferase family protein [Kiloniellales bacterium]|nr:homocysteine S-methyltransferase family protein [Kiloniellales bacterium]
MARYRNALPQLTGGLFLTDGGIETTLIYHEGFELPYFAAFDLLRRPEGRDALWDYYARYAEIARAKGLGFILESATWRASSDWGELLGYSAEDLAEANRQAITLLHDLRRAYETAATPMVVSGCVGPRGDGYDPRDKMTSVEAESYHGRQIAVFAEAGADMVTAITMNYAEEAIGLARAASSAGLPVAISFTVETDGRLPTGQTLKDAIEWVDEATRAAPAYYMINCAHPDHFAHSLTGREAWMQRLRGLRANASRLSHAALDAVEGLDSGDPQEFGRLHGELRHRFGHINVFGGCCGTDDRHIAAITDAVTERTREVA